MTVNEFGDVLGRDVDSNVVQQLGRSDFKGLSQKIKFSMWATASLAISVESLSTVKLK